MTEEILQMKKLILTVSALALSMGYAQAQSISFGTDDGGGDPAPVVTIGPNIADSTAEDENTGVFRSGNSVQTSPTGSSEVRVSGSSSVGSGSLDVDNNGANVQATVQIGNGNAAGTRQWGEDNEAGTIQLGDSNRSYIEQDGNGAGVSGGGRNEAGALQIGTNNGQVTIQRNDDNAASTLQIGRDNMSAILQYTDNNTAAALQLGRDNSSFIAQSTGITSFPASIGTSVAGLSVTSDGSVQSVGSAGSGYAGDNAAVVFQWNRLGNVPGNRSTIIQQGANNGAFATQVTD